MHDREHTGASTPATRPPIRRVNPLVYPRWDAMLAHHPGASFFHGSEWARVLHETYGYTPAYFVTEAEGAITSLLPLMEVDSWLTGRRGISLPFTDECEPLAADAASFQGLSDAVAAMAAARNWIHWELRGGAGRLEAPSAMVYFGHHIALQPDVPNLFSRCDEAVRRAVRKSQQHGLTVRFSRTLEDMRHFHALQCATRQRQGLPPQPWKFFENIQRHVLRPQRGWIVLACSEDRPVAGAVFLHGPRAAIYKYAASDSAFQHMRPNNLVLWRAIEWYARAGFEGIDLGRTSLHHQGLRRFKLGWGAEERRIDYFRYSHRARAFRSARDRTAGWHRNLFRMLPAGVVRLIGAAVYRHVA